MPARTGRARTPPRRIFRSPTSEASGAAATRPASASATSAGAASRGGTGQTEQTFLRASRIPTGRRNATVIDTIGIEVPGGRIVQLGGEDSVESAAAARVAHRRDHLDPVP